MSRWVGARRVLIVLVALLTAIIVPVVASGYVDLSRAQEALGMVDYGAAARYYDAAAWKLPWETGLWEQAAIARAYSRDIPGAVAMFEWLSERGTLSPKGWEIYGGIYQYSKDGMNKAMEIWSAGLQKYPAYSRFYLRLAYGHRLLGDYQDERMWMEKWLAAGKAGAWEHYEMGLLSLASDPQTARQELQHASSMEAGYDLAVKTLDASLDLAAREPNPSRRLVILGRGLGLVNEWALAQDMFGHAVTADSQNAEAWAWLGEARQQLGQDGKSALDKALSLAPDDTLVHGLRGLYWKRLASYRDAVAEYRAAAELEPANPEWQAALGDAYTSAGDLVSALAAYRQATSLSPQTMTYWRLLALFCADNSVQVLDVGLPAAKKAAELAPNDPDVLDALGWTFAQAGLLYNAEQTLVKATDLAPRSALAHFHLAQTYLLKGDQASALRELTLTSQLDPEGPTGKLAAQIIKQYFP